MIRNENLVTPEKVLKISTISLRVNRTAPIAYIVAAFEDDPEKNAESRAMTVMMMTAPR